MTDEIRRNEDDTLDEVVVSGCDFHMEQMDDDLWWIGLTKDGTMMHIWMKAERGLQVFVRDNELGAVGHSDD